MSFCYLAHPSKLFCLAQEMALLTLVLQTKQNRMTEQSQQLINAKAYNWMPLTGEMNKTIMYSFIYLLKTFIQLSIIYQILSNQLYTTNSNTAGAVLCCVYFFNISLYFALLRRFLIYWRETNLRLKSLFKCFDYFF